MSLPRSSRDRADWTKGCEVELSAREDKGLSEGFGLVFIRRLLEGILSDFGKV